jgi:hypothetical protein
MQLGRDELLEAARSLRALVRTVDAGELVAPPLLVARIEGAVVALEALAGGQMPGADDFFPEVNTE